MCVYPNQSSTTGKSKTATGSTYKRSLACIGKEEEEEEEEEDTYKMFDILLPTINKSMWSSGNIK